jgi:hypothetical protein
MHDEKKPGDVLKVPGDPLDDVAGDGALWRWRVALQCVWRQWA